MSILLTQNELMKRRVENQEGILSGLYSGRMKDLDSIFSKDAARALVNSKGEKLESIVVPKNSRWVNSAEYWELWNKIEDSYIAVKKQIEAGVNISQFPDDYYTLIDRIRLDLTRRRMENMDFTSEIAQEMTNPNFSRSLTLQEFLPYTGAFKHMKGSGDTVPMIEQKTGATGSTEILLYGIGWERSLEDELYNTDIFSLQKVMAAVARAYTALRNSLNGIGDAIAHSIAGDWVLAQRVAASTGLATYDLNMYYTLRNAMRKLRALHDPQTGQEINAQRIILLVNENNVLGDIQRIIGGQLSPAVDNGSTLSVAPLQIDEVWQYKGDTLYIDSKKVTFPGVPAGKGYLFVPGTADAPNYVLNKRGLTQEVGRGDVLTLAREKRAWYCAQGSYNDEWFGSTHDADADGTNGYIVEITFPTFDEET